MKRICVIIFLMATVATVLFGCGNNSGKNTDGSMTETDTSTDELPLRNADGGFVYSIVIEADTDNETRKAAIALRSAVIEKFGYGEFDVMLTDDWLSDGDKATASERYEILVGNTSREESREVYASLETGSYRIVASGRKLIIAGLDGEGTALAIEDFIDKFIIGDSILTASLDITGTYKPSFRILEALANTASGKVNPRPVNTVYPTEDVVIADIIVTDDGYGADPNGCHDSTAAINHALTDCASAGGGTVFIPAGKYIVTGQLTVPAYVTLRGDYNSGESGDYGTVLLLYIKSEDSGNTGTVRLGGSGGVVGLTVYYPEQTLDAVKPYPFAFYTDGKTDRHMLSTVRDVTVINGYRGIGACCDASPSHEQLTVENFRGTFLLTAAEVYNQADVGTWENIDISPHFWADAGEEYGAPEIAELTAYMKKYVTGLTLGDLEWTEFIGVRIASCNYGIRIVAGKRIQFAGSVYDCEITDCSTGLLVDELDTRWGMLVANGKLTGSNKAIINRTDGFVRLCGVVLNGGTLGNVETSTNALGDYKINTDTSYKKPASFLYTARLDASAADNTKALQAVLNSAATTGGVVYVPAGVYRFTGAVTVPAGVELRGSGSVAVRCQNVNSRGTVFLCGYGIGTALPQTDRAFITLSGENSGINAIRIIYPDNSPKSLKDTTYTVRGTASGVYCVNCEISSAAYGIDFSGCDGHFIKKLTACCWYNAIKAGGRNGVITGCLQNGTVVSRTGVEEIAGKVTEEELFTVLFPITRAKSVFIILDSTENETVYNTFAYGVKSLINAKDSTGTLCVNLGSDNIGGAQTTVSGGDFTGINFMRYNGSSFSASACTLRLYNRLTINVGGENNIEKIYG